MSQVKPTILNHDEFKSFKQQCAGIFNAWHKRHQPILKGIETNTNPKNIIRILSEDLLTHFADLPLLDAYDVYQRLMDYWDETMQDDLYLIVAEGWVEAVKPRGVAENKEKKLKETPDLTIKKKKYKMDLVPPRLLIERYFPEKQANVEKLQIRQDIATQELEDFIEEHGGEDGLLKDVINDKGKVTKKSLIEQLKSIRNEPENDEEYDVLNHCLALLKSENEASKNTKEIKEALDEQVLVHYTTLTESEVKSLVVDDKWFTSIRIAIENEVEHSVQKLTNRTRELEERYALPLPELERQVIGFSAKVEEHLKRMGCSL